MLKETSLRTCLIQCETAKRSKRDRRATQPEMGKKNETAEDCQKVLNFAQILVNFAEFLR
jgi:hypothetical protein